MDLLDECGDLLAAKRAYSCPEAALTGFSSPASLYSPACQQASQSCTAAQCDRICPNTRPAAVAYRMSRASSQVIQAQPQALVGTENPAARASAGRDLQQQLVNLGLQKRFTTCMSTSPYAVWSYSLPGHSRQPQQRHSARLVSC